MENLDSIFGKKVIAFRQAQRLGYVLDIRVDEKLKILKGIILADEESERELFLPLEKIVSQNEDCVFIEDVLDTELVLDEESNNPLGKVVYDMKGTDLGKVVNLLVSGNRIDKIITDKGEIKPKYIYSVGSDCIIFSLSKKKNEIMPRVFKDKKISKSLPKIEIMNLGDKKIKSAQIGVPVKVYINPSMIINKTATCDVFGLNNELILKKGEIITQNKIEKAKKHGKINYLIFNSK